MDYTPRGVGVIDLGDFQSQSDWDHCGEFSTRPLHGQTVLQRMIRRMSDAQQLLGITVTGSHLPTDVLTCGFVGADVIDLQASHICERLAEVADRTGADWIVYAPANRPFIDPVLIDCLLTHARRNGDFDYVAFASSSDGLKRMQNIGLSGEVIHCDALRRLRRSLDTSPGTISQCNCLADYIQSTPGVYQMRYVPIPTQLDREDLRFAVESEEDWDQLQIIADNVQYDCTDWQPLADIVRRNVEFSASMKARNTLV